jgi:plastocyanin
MAVALAAAMSLVPAAAAAGPKVVRAKMVESDWIWAPKTVRVAAPKRIKWKNSTSEPHSVRFYKGSMKGVRLLILQGESRTKKIKKAGIHKYRCDIPGHSNLSNGKCIGMCGKVVAH